MSRGAGRIERAILAAVEADPDNAFSTCELVERAFPRVKWITKKHRVSVLRAAKKLTAQARGINDFRRGEGLGGQLVFFDRYNVMSYAMARLKVNRFNQYRSRDPRLFLPIPKGVWKKAEDELREMLMPGGSEHKRVVEGGSWWKHVAINIAERDGNAELAATLQAELDADLMAIIGGIRENLGQAGRSGV